MLPSIQPLLQRRRQRCADHDVRSVRRKFRSHVHDCHSRKRPVQNAPVEYDVLEYLAGGMTTDQIVRDFPELTDAHVRAALKFAAQRERRLAESA